MSVQKYVLGVFRRYEKSLLARKELNKTWKLNHTLYLYGILKFSETCVKRPLKNRQNKDLNDKW